MTNKTIDDFSKFDFKSLGQYLLQLSPFEVATLGCLLGLVLIPPLNAKEQNSVGNFLELIGQVLLSSSSQDSVINPSLDEKTFNTYKKSINNDISYLYNLIKNKFD